MTTTSIEQLRARLTSVPLFSRCHPGDLASVAERSEIRDVTAGDVLIKAGDVGEEFFVLLAGTAEVTRNGRNVVALQPGDHFGELALLDPAPRDADITMTEDGVVSVLSRHNFLLALDAVPGITPALLAFLARRVRTVETDPALDRA